MRNGIRYALLIIKKTHSNIFLTLCDIKKKVIVCKTSGSSRVGRKKKLKRSPQAIEGIMPYLRWYFDFYKISALKILLDTKISAHVYILIKELGLIDIDIISFLDIRRLPHNGMRQRKMRRV